MKKISLTLAVNGHKIIFMVYKFSSISYYFLYYQISPQMYMKSNSSYRSQLPAIPDYKNVKDEVVRLIKNKI